SGELVKFAERFNLPVATSFRRTSLFPGDHPNYAGDLGIGPDPRLKARLQNADLIILIGGRLSEMPSSSYTILQVPTPRQKLVHVHPGSEELGRVYQPELAIQACPATFCAALKELGSCSRASQSKEAELAHADYLDWSSVARELPGRFQYGSIVRWLSDRLPPNAI